MSDWSSDVCPADLPLFGLAIGAAHGLRPVDEEELRLALVRDRPRQPGLAGARRAVQQHPARRIDAQPAEKLGIAQRQLDHLAQLVDRVAKAAELVLGYGGAPCFLRFLVFGKQLHLRSIGWTKFWEVGCK